VVHRFKNVGDTTARMLDWAGGGQDHYFKRISELAADGGFTGEKVVEISKEFDTKFPAAHRAAGGEAAPEQFCHQFADVASDVFRGCEHFIRRGET
jgi:hypothetical protein